MKKGEEKNKKAKCIAMYTYQKLSHSKYYSPYESSGTSCDFLPFGSIPIRAFFFSLHIFEIFKWKFLFAYFLKLYKVLKRSCLYA